MRSAPLLVLLVACGAPAVGPTDLNGVPVDPLADAAFAFCHDVDRPVRLSPEDHRELCPLLDDADPDACPSLRSACDGVADTDVGPPSSGGCDGDSEASSTPRSPEFSAPPEPAPMPPLQEVGLAMIGEIVRWTIAFAVALLVAGLLVVAVRAFMRWLARRAPAAQVVEPAPVRVDAIDVPTVDALPVAPSADLLGAARVAVEEGRFTDAVLLCRGAALKSLSDSGKLRLHASRTDREYVRSLRRVDGERHGALRSLMRVVEAVRWGGAPISAEQAKQAILAASRIVAIALAVLVLMGPDRALGGPATDYDLDGSAALQRVFEQHDFEVRWRLRSLQTADDQTEVLIVDAGALWLAPADERALRRWVEGGGILVIAGSAGAGFPELGQLEKMDRATLRASRPVRDHGLALPVPFGDGVVGYAEAHGTPWLIADSPDETLVVVQAVQLGSGTVIGLADRRYLTNVALVSRSNTHFLGTLLYVGESMNYFELMDPASVELATLAGTDGSAVNNPLATLANARLLPLVLQILALVALVGLWRGWPFGPPKDAPTEGRIRFADHAVALGQRFARVRATRHAAAAQAQLWLARMGPVALQAAAERQGYAPEDARNFVSRVQALADDPHGPNAASDVNLVEELWRVTSP